MKREGKCFSGRVTPLFQTMMVQAHEEMGEGSEIPTDPHHTPIITQPSSSQPQRKQKSRKSKKKNTEVPQPSGSTDNVPDENVPTTSNDPLLSGEDRLKLTELMDLCTNLQKKVLDLEKAKTAQDSEIASLKKKVKKLERRNKSRTQPGCEIGESSAAAAARQPGPTMAHKSITVFCGAEIEGIRGTSYSIETWCGHLECSVVGLKMVCWSAYHAYPAHGGWARVDTLRGTLALIDQGVVAANGLSRASRVRNGLQLAMVKDQRQPKLLAELLLL
ncbi:hypothetical protein Tco_1220832 [Tanacetum coccineum]